MYSGVIVSGWFMKCKRCGKFSLSALFASLCPACQEIKKAEDEKLDNEQTAEAQKCYDEMNGLLRSNALKLNTIPSIMERCPQPKRQEVAEGFLKTVCDYSVSQHPRMFTKEEYATIDKLAEILDVDDNKKEVIVLVFENIIQKKLAESGELPVLDVPIPLNKKEVAHFHYKKYAEFLQERVTGRSYEGGSQGFSFRIAKGVRYNVGAHRGRLITETDIVLIDTGSIIITSDRFCFSGPKKAFSFKLNKLLNISSYADGISLVVDSKAQNAKPYIFKYHDADALSLGLSACIEKYC